mmetsp:Transcript_8967/g.13002  ORF Transcript_8967/g.13002 Transcript_8967/m.13002 type:complete len:93 (+) Transcript_8967:779-1057(+)
MRGSKETVEVDDELDSEVIDTSDGSDSRSSVVPILDLDFKIDVGADGEELVLCSFGCIAFCLGKDRKDGMCMALTSTLAKVMADGTTVFWVG